MAVRDTARDLGGHSSQQEAVIPDSEESPGRCFQQRQDSLAASPARNEHHCGACTDASAVSLQHSLPQQSIGQHASADQAMSGCSVEALPRHTQPEVCTQSVPADQRTGQALGCGVHSQVANQQQTGPPQPLNVAAGSRQHVLDAGAQTLPATAVGSAAASAAPDQLLAQPSTCGGLGHSARPGLEPSLTVPHQPTLMLQRTDASLPGFGDPVALAPAGPTEHLWGDQKALGVVEATTGSDHQPGVGQEPLGVQARVAGADQHVSRAHQLEGSQPSSSSLKRVPETPDSAENRSQPTQSPNGQSHSSVMFAVLRQGILPSSHQPVASASRQAQDVCILWTAIVQYTSGGVLLFPEPVKTKEHFDLCLR